MYQLAAAAGGRWELPTPEEIELTETYERYIKATERCAGRWADKLEAMLGPGDWNGRANPYWSEVARELALDLDEESEVDHAALTPDGYETVQRYYEKHAAACVELAESILSFLPRGGKRVCDPRRATRLPRA